MRSVCLIPDSSLKPIRTAPEHFSLSSMMCFGLSPEGASTFLVGWPTCLCSVFNHVIQDGSGVNPSIDGSLLNALHSAAWSQALGSGSPKEAIQEQAPWSSLRHRLHRGRVCEGGLQGRSRLTLNWCFARGAHRQ